MKAKILAVYNAAGWFTLGAMCAPLLPDAARRLRRPMAAAIRFIDTWAPPRGSAS